MIAAVDLASAFAALAPPAARDADARELDRALAALAESAKGEFPHLPVSAAELVEHAARQMPADVPAERIPAAIDALHAADLLLAFACARGVPAALAIFDERHLAAGPLSAAVARIDRSPAFADEVRQQLREKLLLGAGGRPPRIAEYTGRGALSSWVRVVAMRAALDLRPTAAQLAEGAAVEETAATTTEPELRYLKDRYGKPFQEAVAAAFASLDDEQCNLLRLQLVDGLRTAQIAALFHVDRSTIKRRLSACRDRLLSETQRLLREKLGLSPAEFASLAGLVQSQLQLSVERLLKR
jgi:RNA polymerase sigma-70 factor (ECF subfamily)